MASTGIYGVRGTRLGNGFLGFGSNTTYIVEYMCIHNLLAHLAAYLKYSGIPTNDERYLRAAILASIQGNAVLLDLLGSFNVPLNCTVCEHRSRDNTVEIPPPIYHAICNMDLASIELLGRYNSIGTVKDVSCVTRALAHKMLLKVNKRNEDLVIRIFEFVHPIVVATTNFQFEYGVDRIFWSGLSAIFNQDCDRVFTLLLSYGMDPKLLCGPAGGSDLAARSGAIECLKIMAEQDIDLSYEPTSQCCRALWICLRLESESPLVAAKKANRQECVEFIESYIAAKEAGELRKFIENLHRIPLYDTVAAVEPVVAIPLTL